MTHGAKLMAVAGDGAWWTVVPVQLRLVCYLWLIAILLAKIFPWLLRNGALAIWVVSTILADALLAAEYVITSLRRRLGRSPGPVTFAYGNAVVGVASGINKAARAANASSLLRTRRLSVWPFLVAVSVLMVSLWHIPDYAADESDTQPFVTTLTNARAPFVAFDALMTGRLASAQNASPPCPKTKSPPAYHSKNPKDGS